MPIPRQVTQAIPPNLENDPNSTIISIVPFLINEFKPGIYPGRFTIQPCIDANKPEILHVGTSVYFIPQFNGDDELPAHVVKTPSHDIAKSIVNDYLSAQMDTNPECQPGIAWLDGKLAIVDITTKHRNLLQDLKKYQINWFGKLVQRADNDWNRYKRHTVVSDVQRFAAKALSLERDWLTPESHEIPVKCPSCLTNCDRAAVVCANCRCILDQERYKKLTFAA